MLLMTTLDYLIRQPKTFRAREQIFRKGYPWPYFHTVEGMAEQLKSKEVLWNRLNYKHLINTQTP